MLAFGPPAWGSCKDSPALSLFLQLLEEVAWLQLLLLSDKFNFTSTAEVQMSSGAKCFAENLASPSGEAVDRVTFVAKQNIGDVCSSEIPFSLTYGLSRHLSSHFVVHLWASGRASQPPPPFPICQLSGDNRADWSFFQLIRFLWLAFAKCSTICKNHVTSCH